MRASLRLPRWPLLILVNNAACSFVRAHHLAGRKHHLDDGTPFLWRTASDGEPDIKLWKKSYLDSGEPFWFTADGPQEVSLTDPFEHSALHDEL